MRVARTIAVLATALAMVTAACSSDGGNPIFTGGSSEGTGDGPFGVSSGSEDTGPGEGIGGQGDSPDESGDGIGFEDLGSASSRPLPLREGLGTFNNYEWHMEFSTVGPTADERMDLITDWSHNNDPESNFSRTATTQTGPDFETPESTTQEVYAVEGDTCQFDGEDWTFTGATDQQREVLDVAERLFDFTIVPENPVEIGQETVAGIPATHYRYSVAGFGAESGALVTANDMDYWVANDTGVLLKYTMVVESRSGPTSDPEAEVYLVEASAELMSANVVVPISLPEGCLAEKAASES